MKTISVKTSQGARWLVLWLCLLAGSSAWAAGPFTVTVTNDTHAVTPASSPSDSGGHISLRSAIEAANAQTGATIINVPTGIYPLTLGELDLSPTGGKTLTLLGAGAATTIISQSDPTNRVLNIDFASAGTTVTAISGFTIQGGHDGNDLDGGAGILAGSVAATPKDVLGLTNCVIQNNHCTSTNTTETGGGVQMAGGDLNVTGCTFTNNSSGQSFGGGIFMLEQTVVCSLTVSNSVFGSNNMTNNSGAGPDGGGAIYIETPATSVHNISRCTFVNNRVLGNSGSTYGGAIQINGGILNITISTFLANSVIGAGGLGGAIYADSGTVNMSFCRLTGNSASVGGGAFYNHGSGGANTTAANNWWGCDGGPGVAGCDVTASDGGTLTTSPWLFFTNTASPTTISYGQSTTLTMSVLKNSAGQAITAAQVPVLIGLPLVWVPGLHGSFSSIQSTIQPNGTATAVFNNDNTCSSDLPGVSLDNDISTATVTVQCPDLSISKNNNVGGSVAFGSGGWTWTVHVANVGVVAAPFATGNTIALDDMPNVSITYGTPTIANQTGVTGTLVPGIDVNNNLTVTASGAVSLAAGGSFDVQVTATPTAPGTFGNPRSGGVCKVNPNNNVPEANVDNNTANNTVTAGCPTITGTVSGGGAICPGNSGVVMVSMSGGVPPYSVTLNNGGGTQSGTGPFIFSVSPSSTTTYQVSSGSDADGCSITDSGSATVTVNPAILPAITLSPTSVVANSGGNLASVPNIYSSYAWTISNGSIVGPANQSTVSYTAGNSNNPTLSVTVANATGCASGGTVTVPLIKGLSVHTNVTFLDRLPSTTMGMTFDGTNYWSCAGGGAGQTNLAVYSLTGVVLANYIPNLDLRSVMVRPDGTVLARAFNTNIIYQQTSPGVFVNSGVSLTGGTLNAQSSVTLNSAGNEFDAMNVGVISRWSTNGTYLGSVNLIGFGSVSGENSLYQNRGLAVIGSLWLTYNGAGILSVWDSNGNRINQLTLPGAGTSPDSEYSFSFCNGKVFIVDVAGGAWRAFDLYGSAATAVISPEATAAWNSDVVSKISGVGFVPKVDFIGDGSPNPEPTLAQLLAYQSVLVYSDQGFSNPTNIGNALADYTDQGGGVVLSTFVFYNAVSGPIAMQGRLLTGGYLPFTVGTQTENSDQTMVIDQAASPLLDGVTAFDGGASSYMNNGITTNVGVPLVAHWSGGQPLVAGRNDGAGRNAGLNFFPPSSDVGGGLWVSGTGGARLMADALVWAGRIPPTITSAPTDQVLPAGATASFKAQAVGATGLGYQWRLNGTNIIGQTSSNLTFTVQANSFGAYSVVISNLYGNTVSFNTALNPPLRFLGPVITAGQFPLVLVDSDGSAVAANRATRVSLYSTTNLALPFGSWILRTNGFVSNGSQLISSPLTVSKGVNQFFRAVETP